MRWLCVWLGVGSMLMACSSNVPARISPNLPPGTVCRGEPDPLVPDCGAGAQESGNDSGPADAGAD